MPTGTPTIGRPYSMTRLAARPDAAIPEESVLVPTLMIRDRPSGDPASGGAPPLPSPSGIKSHRLAQKGDDRSELVN
jgi:hypothetical protein